MNKESVQLHIRTLFRNKDKRHYKVISAFFDNDKSHENYPAKVETKVGKWFLEDCGSERVYGERLPYKVWAIYQIEQEENPDDIEQLPVGPDGPA